MNQLSRLLGAAALVLPLYASAEIRAYVALPLTPTQEPTAPASNGTGTLTALYNTETKVLMYSIVFQLNPGSTATNAHFHGPADLGANAGVAIGLPVLPTGNAGNLTGTVTLTATQEADLLAGHWYLNIHSTLAAGGELRAQMIENPAALVVPKFADGKVILPVVLVPGAAGSASYSAELTYNGGNSFTLSGATPLR